MKRYPFLELGPNDSADRECLVAAVTRVIDSGRYVGGDEVARFEKRLSTMTGTTHVVGVANGLDALRLIFRAFIEMGRMSPGDEVIVPANTYIASVLAVSDNGLRPVFVEPDMRTLNLDWSLVESAVSDRTRAVLPVHLYGRASWNEQVAARLRQRGIVIVEDNAQAIGAKLADGRHTGALGDAGAFSFYPTKNIGAIGDAGAVTTNSEQLAAVVRALANYGSDRRYHNIYCGLNSRLDPIQAAVLGVRLDRLDAEMARRRAIARVYSTSIKHPDIILPLEGAEDMVWHQYVVRTGHRDALIRHLEANGVGYDIHYAVPPHRQPCYAEYSGLDLPRTDTIADTVLSLPVGHPTTPETAGEIASIINDF